MKTLQFEAIKMAIKQDKDGYVLTLRMHPDEIPEDLLRDFVGARYSCVLVRLSENEAPMERADFAGDKSVRLAGMLCRNPRFWAFLSDSGYVYEPTEEEAQTWLREYLDVASRADLKTNASARIRLDSIHEEFTAWTLET
jgi:hypothetical protein